MHKQGNGQTLHCPVFLTKQFGEEAGYMQPSIDSGGRARDSTRIPYDTATKDFRKNMMTLGHGHLCFTEHSGRWGGASATAGAGVPWLLLKRLGHWRSDSAKSTNGRRFYVGHRGDRAGSVTPRSTNVGVFPGQERRVSPDWASGGQILAEFDYFQICSSIRVFETIFEI